MFYTYKYKIKEFIWNDSGNYTTITDNHVRSIAIEYNYITTNRPIIRMHLRLEKWLYNNMIKKKDSATMLLALNKYAVEKDIRHEEPYISRKEFYYFLESDTEVTDALDEQAVKDNIDAVRSNDNYVEFELGLICKDLIDDNKIYASGIFASISNKDALFLYTSHLKWVVERFNETTFGSFIMPPISSVTKLIEYLNSRYAFYSTDYRLFFDFDYTYLLSSIPKATELRTYPDIFTVIIEIGNITNKSAKELGMEVDNEKKVYTTKVSSQYATYYKNNYLDKTYNQIVGVDSYGNKRVVNVNGDMNNPNSTTKRLVVRVDNNNMGQISQLKNNIENNNIMVSIIKIDIDSSIFTLNKRYIIDNKEDKNREYNGSYLLHTKIDTLIKDEAEDFTCTVNLVFQKGNS